MADGATMCFSSMFFATNGRVGSCPSEAEFWCPSERAALCRFHHEGHSRNADFCRAPSLHVPLADLPVRRPAVGATTSRGPKPDGGTGS